MTTIALSIALLAAVVLFLVERGKRLRAEQEARTNAWFARWFSDRYVSVIFADDPDVDDLVRRPCNTNDGS